MSRKQITMPLLLFVVVFVVSQVFQHASLMHQENLSLFLITRDYFAQTLREPLPISTLVSNFLLGFYRFPFIGAVVSACLVLIVYSFACRIVARVTSHYVIPACTVSILAWLRLSLASSPRDIVFFIFLELIVFALCFFIKDRKVVLGRMELLICVVLAAGASSYVALSGRVSSAERWAKIEQATKNHQWDSVLRIATVERAAEDREMIPFALLALNAKGRMSSDMLLYPVRDFEDLDMEGVRTRRGYFFSSILQECLGSNLEALHLICQSGCTVQYGTSMMVLRQSLKHNIALGDQRMISKYVEVLKKSPANRAMAKAVARRYLNGGHEDMHVDNASQALVTNNPIQNLALMAASGLESEMLVDRYNAFSIIYEMKGLER